MELLGPAFFVIHDGEFIHHGGFEFAIFERGNRPAAAETVENAVDLVICVIFGVCGFQAVVGEVTAHVVKELVAIADGREIRGEIFYIGV